MLQNQYPDIDWDKVLARDPVGCARSFVCQMVATNLKELQHSETTMLDFIR